MEGKFLELKDCVMAKSPFQGKDFISFLRENGVNKSRLNLNMKEWKALISLQGEIRARLKNPGMYELKVEGMTNRYLVRSEESKYYFFDEEDAVSYGIEALGQDPCLTVCTILANPTEQEVVA